MSANAALAAQRDAERGPTAARDWFPYMHCEPQCPHCLGTNVWRENVTAYARRWVCMSCERVSETER